jgi:hypothetical protein
MDSIDQAFWQLFHAVDAKMRDPTIIDTLTPDTDPAGSVAIELPGPVHALGVLRREAERRGVSPPELIAILSEERKADLPEWWLAAAENRAVGVLQPERGTTPEAAADSSRVDAAEAASTRTGLRPRAPP